jgi:hypothetical protein
MRRVWWVAGGIALLAAGAAGGYLAHLPQANAVWIPVIAALGASLLTTVAVFGVELLREQDAKRSAVGDHRRNAYARFLDASATFMSRASEAHEIRRIATGAMAPASIDNGVEFLQKFNRELDPLMHAWSAVWLSGSSEAIKAANKLIDATTPTMRAASAQGKAVPALVARIVGEKWTEQQERDFLQALRNLGLLRREFANVARREIGEPIADLFAGIEPTDAPPRRPKGSSSNVRPHPSHSPTRGAPLSLRAHPGSLTEPSLSKGGWGVLPHVPLRLADQHAGRPPLRRDSAIRPAPPHRQRRRRP